VDGAAAQGGDGSEAKPLASLRDGVARVQQSLKEGRSTKLLVKPGGIELDPSGAHWRIAGTRDPSEFLRALDGWLPDGAVLRLEDGSQPAEVESCLAANAAPEPTRVAAGAAWPRPYIYHVLATHACLQELARIMEHHAAPELAIHVHAYREGRVILQWYDAFNDPLFVDGEVAEERVKVLADRLGTTYSRSSVGSSSAATPGRRWSRRLPRGLAARRRFGGLQTDERQCTAALPGLLGQAAQDSLLALDQVRPSP
jgi:hypothetical protein